MAQDFKAFATDPAANVISQALYAAWARLPLGWASGIVDSRYFNKGLRQATFIAEALATFVNGITAVSTLDDGNVAGFVTNLTNALKLLASGGVLYTAGGTANAKTITPSPALTGYAAGQLFEVRAPGAANSGAVTLNVNGLGAKAVVNHDLSAVASGQWPTGVIATVIYDGTQFVWLDGFTSVTPPDTDSSTWNATTAWVTARFNQTNLGIHTTTGLTLSLSSWYRLDTRLGAFSVTLPASPVDGQAVRLSDEQGLFASAPVTVLRNGFTIQGVAEDMILNVPGIDVMLIYDGAGNWKLS